MKNNILNTAGKQRLAYIDAIKCLGILLVISGHVQFMGMGIEAYDSPLSLMLYSFNMPLFFFVSGLLAFKEKISTWQVNFKYIGNKFLYLVVPAIVFTIIYHLKDAGIDRFYILKHGFGIYWFTFTLFEIFFIYYVIYSIAKSKNCLVASMVVISILGVGYLSFFSNYESVLLDFNHLAKYFQFFTLGVLAKMYPQKYEALMRNDYLKTGSIICFFVLLFSLYSMNMPAVVMHFLRDIVLRYLGLYVVVAFFYCNQNSFDRPGRLNDLIMKIGKSSLAIYLLQYFFMPDFSAYSGWLAGLDWLSISLISFVYTCFITAICLVFIELLSESHFIKKYILGQR